MQMNSPVYRLVLLLSKNTRTRSFSISFIFSDSKMNPVNHVIFCSIAGLIIYCFESK